MKLIFISVQYAHGKKSNDRLVYVPRNFCENREPGHNALWKNEKNISTKKNFVKSTVISLFSKNVAFTKFLLKK